MGDGLFYKREKNFDIYKFDKEDELQFKRSKNAKLVEAFVNFATGDGKNLFTDQSLFPFTIKWAPTIKLNKVYMKSIERRTKTADNEVSYERNYEYKFNGLHFQGSTNKRILPLSAKR